MPPVHCSRRRRRAPELRTRWLRLLVTVPSNPSSVRSVHFARFLAAASAGRQDQRIAARELLVCRPSAEVSVSEAVATRTRSNFPVRITLPPLERRDQPIERDHRTFDRREQVRIACQRRRRDPAAGVTAGRSSFPAARSARARWFRAARTSSKCSVVSGVMRVTFALKRKIRAREEARRCSACRARRSQSLFVKATQLFGTIFG